MSDRNGRPDWLLGRSREEGGAGLPAGLPAPILRSWQRCIDQGLDLAERPRREPLTARELASVIDRNGRLLAAARPELDALGSETEATGSIAILTDASGMILEAVGDALFADRAARVALKPGADWGETVSGTNAIGTALVEGASVAVHGAEHFFVPHRMLNCSASPIRSPTGDLMGVLDISSSADVSHLHALGLVRLSVDQIEHRLFFEDGFDHHDVVRLHADPALLGTAREGLLVFEDGRLVAANRHALAMFGLLWRDLGHAEAACLIDGGLGGLGESGRAVRSTTGIELVASVDRRSRRAHLAPVSRPTATRGRDEPVFDADSQNALQRAVRLIASGVPILITGEAGVGKEVFARAAHDAGRLAGSFVRVDCAVTPPGELDAALFGDSPQLLVAADGGTLFLDNISALPPQSQRRLVAALSEAGSVPPSGRSRWQTVRLVSSTRASLDGEVEAGQFLADLYFRVAQYAVALPSLREIDGLDLVIDKLFGRLGGLATDVTLAADALERLAAYHWPGNFRQLAGTLKALIALADPGDRIRVSDLPAYLAAPPQRAATADAPPSAADVALPLSDLELRAMQTAVSEANGNMSLAAKRLNIHRSTLYRRLFAADRPLKSG